MQIVEYTVNIGNYDLLREDLICIDDIDIFKNNARNSRMPKILSHLFIDADVSVYYDANMHLIKGLDINKIVKEYLGDADIVAMKGNMGRDCVYEEIEAAKNRVPNEHEKNLLTKQGVYYKSIGFPDHCGTLAAYQPLIRRHNDIVRAFNNEWWAQLCRFSYRDQVSFPYVLSLFPDLKVNWIEDFANIRYRNYRHKYHPKVNE